MSLAYYKLKNYIVRNVNKFLAEKILIDIRKPQKSKNWTIKRNQVCLTRTINRSHKLPMEKVLRNFRNSSVKGTIQLIHQIH